MQPVQNGTWFPLTKTHPPPVSFHLSDEHLHPCCFPFPPTTTLSISRSRQLLSKTYPEFVSFFPYPLLLHVLALTVSFLDLNKPFLTCLPPFHSCPFYNAFSLQKLGDHLKTQSQAWDSSVFENSPMRINFAIYYGLPRPAWLSSCLSL